MYTGNVWGIALLVAGFLASLIGLELLLAALMPARSAATVRALRERPLAAGLAGFPALGLLIGTAIALGRLGGPGKLLAALVLVAASIAIVTGLAAVARLVGERMPSPADEGRPWRATLRGAITCGLAFAAPFVGWFIMLPGSAAMGTGALIVSAFSASRAPAPSAAAVSA